MKIVEPVIKRITEQGLKKIELIGKVCTKQEHTIKEGSAAKFCTNRLIDGHTAIFEHEYVYYDLRSIDNEIIENFIKLSPYIRLSYNGYYVGFCYRVFLDIIANSRRMKDRFSLICYDNDVNDIFWIMLLQADEFSSLLYNREDIITKIHLGERNRNFLNVERIDSNRVLSVAPEIYNVTYLVRTDRGVTHETVRHKEMSFMQESTRWCNYSGDKFGSSITVLQPEFKTEEAVELWSDGIDCCEAIYNDMINAGETPQLARSVLPNSTKSDIYISGTLDMWIGEHLETVYPKLTIEENKGFLPLRNHSHAHPQMIEIAKMIEDNLHATYGSAIQQIINYY